MIRRLRTPALVQRFLNALPYNTEPPPERAKLRSFRGVLRHQTAHCLEAALAAAVILEQHGYPPLVLSFESIDNLDHVIFIYRRAGRWGAIGRSRDPGLHGRKPVFRTPRDLALSYVDGYVDYTGRVTGYAVVDLRLLGDYDWRLSEKNVWKVERLLLDVPHREIRSSDTPDRPAARAIPEVQAAVPGPKADLLRRQTQLDGVTTGVQGLGSRLPRGRFGPWELVGRCELGVGSFGPHPPIPDSPLPSSRDRSPAWAS